MGSEGLLKTLTFDLHQPGIYFYFFGPENCLRFFCVLILKYIQGFPCGSEVKASAYNAGDSGLIPGLGRFPWRRKWKPTPRFLPGESQGQWSLVGYSPQGCKELDTTERLHFHCQY